MSTAAASAASAAPAGPDAAPIGLSDEQLAFFDREGYLVVDELFDDRVIQALRDEIAAEIDARATKLVASGELSRTYAEEDFEHRLARINDENPGLAHSIWNGVLCGPAIFELIRYPRLLDIAEQLCGPELIASSVYRIRPKVPNHVMSAVPWHQDSGYFEPYCDRALVLTVWLPLVDATEANGCLWVKPRSHKGKVIDHYSKVGKPYLLIRDEDLPDVAPVCVPVRRGGALLLSNLTPHASFANTTDAVRWSMDLRYQSASLPTNADITRLPGETIANPDAGVPLACFPPEADFLVRSKLRPNEVVRDAATFHRLRTQHQKAPVATRWSRLP
jgi:ectoine hydroxylase-related dioxygenase (phytanoyl-CoA dioxygenase family)